MILVFLVLFVLASDAFCADYGVNSVQFMTGYVVSPVIQANQRPDLNYGMGNIRFEWARFGKHFKSLAELTYSQTTTGCEGYFAGGTLILRYDFDSIGKVTPYAQIGAGIVYTNMGRDYSQDLVGNEIEFNPQASIGLRYRVNPKWSIDTEGMFHHVSNAGLGDRNVGVNGLGGFIGLTYYYK
jgi:opacity protein-like surface antigen